MKCTLIIILTFGIFACNNSQDNNSANNQTVPAKKDSLIHVDKKIINGSSGNKEFYTCDFDKYVKDSKTPKLAKDIYLDNEWNLNSDYDALALLDSLTAKDKTSRPFYFKVVTKSEKKSDGYYSEGLGYAGYNYVMNNTKEFASFFDNKLCHTNSDLDTWADIVIMEFNIIGEGKYDKPIVDDYIKKLKTNCKNCSTGQKETINKYGLTLKEKWNEFLKYID